MVPRTRDRLVIAAWLAWAGFVLSHYYVQALRAAVAGRLPSRSEMIGVLPILLVAGSGTLIWVVISSRSVSVLRLLVGRMRGLRPMLASLAAVMTIPWFLLRDRLAASVSGLSVSGLPWIGEAAARACIALVGASLVAGAALGAGAIVLRLIGWKATSRIEQVVFAAATGVGAVYIGSLLLAVTGLYTPMAIAVLIAVLLLAGVRRSPAFQTDWPQRRVSIVTGVWLALGAVALAYGLIAALAPEKEYDALWYHLQLPRLWMEAGHPVDLIEEYVSLYPLTWELVFGAGMVLGGPVGAKLLHFACLPLLALLVAETVRRFLPGVCAAMAAALVVTVPTLLWESGTAYVDLAMTLHAAAGCYALARYAETRERAWGILAALQLGLAASTKHLGVIVTVIALVLFVVRSGGRVKSALRPAILIALLAAAVPSPWYVRAWLASGNPVFPEMFSIFGASPPDRWDALSDRGLAGFKAHFGLGRSAHALVMLPWNVTVHGALFGGAIGPVFLVLLPGLGLARRHAPRLRVLAWGVVAYLAVWASPIGSFQLRFLMPIVPPLALLAAASAEAINRRAGNAVQYGNAVATGALVFLGVLNLPPFASIHEPDRVGWYGWLTHVLREPPLHVVAGRESETEYLRREVPSSGAWYFINTHLGADVRVLTFAGGDQLYSSRARISHDAPMARSAVFGSAAENVSEAVESLRRLGITHVLFDRRELKRLQGDSVAIASPRFQQVCILEYDDPRYWVCRVDYSRATLVGSQGTE